MGALIAMVCKEIAVPKCLTCDVSFVCIPMGGFFHCSRVCVQLFGLLTIGGVMYVVGSSLRRVLCPSRCHVPLTEHVQQGCL